MGLISLPYRAAPEAGTKRFRLLAQKHTAKVKAKFNFIHQALYFSAFGLRICACTSVTISLFVLLLPLLFWGQCFCFLVLFAMETNDSPQRTHSCQDRESFADTRSYQGNCCLVNNSLSVATLNASLSSGHIKAKASWAMSTGWRKASGATGRWCEVVGRAWAPEPHAPPKS